jgi:mitochondrial fission protein ELM1
MKRWFTVAVLLAAATGATAQDRAEFPEHGTVIAVGVGGSSKKVQYSSDSASHVYRVETTKRFYELMDKGKKPSLTLNQTVEFRVEKKTAVVWDGKKGRKYSLTDAEDKVPTAQTAPDSSLH